MNYLLKNGWVYTHKQFVKQDLFIIGGKVFFSAPETYKTTEEMTVIDLKNQYIIPGLIDVHVHLREPGFLYKETIRTGTEAGASAGYNAVFTMPNLKPVPDTIENLKVQQDIIDKDAVIKVYPYASITKGEKGAELSDMEALSEKVLAFSDDGVGVQSDDMMEQAMAKAQKLDKLIVAHCEDNSLLDGGYIHDGEYARIHNHKGICSASEYKQIERDLELAKKTKVKYHICHVSAKESVEAIRKAKKEGVNVTAETCPHYLVFDDMDLKEDGSFKMNPPIRSKEDKEALINGIKDGTLEIITTDHAPHSQEEKSKGLRSLNGIVGLETAFPVLYTSLVKGGIISMSKLLELMGENPAKRFGIKWGIKENELADLAVFDLDTEYQIDPEKFFSKGRSTPFKDRNVYGKCLYNFCNGNLVFAKGKILK